MMYHTLLASPEGRQFVKNYVYFWKFAETSTLLAKILAKQQSEDY